MDSGPVVVLGGARGPPCAACGVVEADLGAQVKAVGRGPVLEEGSVEEVDVVGDDDLRGVTLEIKEEHAHKGLLGELVDDNKGAGVLGLGDVLEDGHVLTPTWQERMR